MVKLSEFQMEKLGVITDEPWVDNGWTKARYFSFIRSALRGATMKYPAKQKYLEQKSYKAPKGSRAKKLVDCEECSKSMAKSNAHVDHIIACGSLQDFSDIERFVSTLFCGLGNFRVLCKECNEIYAYSDKQGVSFEESAIEKRVISITKDNSIEKQKEMLLNEGFIISEMGNSVQRRDLFRILEKRKPSLV